MTEKKVVDVNGKSILSRHSYQIIDIILESKENSGLAENAIRSKSSSPKQIAEEKTQQKKEPANLPDNHPMRAMANSFYNRPI